MSKQRYLSQAQVAQLTLFLSRHADQITDKANYSKSPREIAEIVKAETGISATPAKIIEICDVVGHPYYRRVKDRQQANATPQTKTRILARALLRLAAGKPLMDRQLESLIMLADYDKENQPDHVLELVTNPKPSVVSLPHRGEVK